jgi:hypothetical protein
MVLKSIFGKNPSNKKELIEYAKKKNKKIRITLLAEINVNKKKETQLIIGTVVYSCEDNSRPLPIPNKIKCGYYEVLSSIAGSKDEDHMHPTNNHNIGKSVIKNMYDSIKPILSEFDQAGIEYTLSDYNLIKLGVNYYL